MHIEKIHSSTEITVFHLRAARAALKFSFKELSELSTVSERALIRLEQGNLDLPPQGSGIVTIGKVRALYEENGIEFYKNNFIHISSQESRFTIRILNK
jgi:transcriptional regulator with XRE-family HTH domain